METPRYRALRDITVKAGELITGEDIKHVYAMYMTLDEHNAYNQREQADTTPSAIDTEKLDSIPFGVDYEVTPHKKRSTRRKKSHKPLSQKKKDVMIRDFQNGVSPGSTAKKLGLRPESVYNFRCAYRKTLW